MNSYIKILDPEEGMAFILDMIVPLVEQNVARADLTMAIQLCAQRTIYTKNDIRKIVADIKKT